MYRLIELTFASDKESQAIYPYESAIALEGDYETKLGAAMEAKLDDLLIALDETGRVAFGSNGTILSAKVGDYEFLPRLFEAKLTTQEDVDLIKCDTTDILSARFHKKKGAAIKNNAVMQEILVGINGYGAVVEYCQWIRPVEEEEIEPEEE